MSDIAELRGRLVMLESVVAATLTHLAATTADPARLIVAIMANAEDMIEAAEGAAAPEDRDAIHAARASFDHFSDAMQQFILQRGYSEPRQ